jgi:hypothetical protein
MSRGLGGLVDRDALRGDSGRGRCPQRGKSSPHFIKGTAYQGRLQLKGRLDFNQLEGKPFPFR